MVRGVVRVYDEQRQGFGRLGDYSLHGRRLRGHVVSPGIRVRRSRKLRHGFDGSRPGVLENLPVPEQQHGGQAPDVLPESARSYRVVRSVDVGYDHRIVHLLREPRPFVIHPNAVAAGFAFHSDEPNARGLTRGRLRVMLERRIREGDHLGGVGNPCEAQKRQKRDVRGQTHEESVRRHQTDGQCAGETN